MVELEVKTGGRIKSQIEFEEDELSNPSDNTETEEKRWVSESSVKELLTALKAQSKLRGWYSYDLEEACKELLEK